jgi:hypothetical protein
MQPSEKLQERNESLLKVLPLVRYRDERMFVRKKPEGLSHLHPFQGFLLSGGSVPECNTFEMYPKETTEDAETAGIGPSGFLSLLRFEKERQGDDQGERKIRKRERCSCAVPLTLPVPIFR